MKQATMKKILGLDLGVSSIGWAIIEEYDEAAKSKILGTGVRIVPITTAEKDEFLRGFRKLKNQKQTLHLSFKKDFDGYQQRREKLKRILKRHGLYPEDFLFRLSATEIYGLRARAATEKVGKNELGRILLHLCQRRIYKDFKIEAAVKSGRKVNADNKRNLAPVKWRYRLIRERGITVGQYFFHGLLEDPHFQVKNKVFPKSAYIEEYDKIMRCQGLPRELVQKIRNEILFSHRPNRPNVNLAGVYPLAGKSKIVSSEKDGSGIIHELPLLSKNALGQPVVEKVLNQMIHLVNAVNKEFGRPEEIRIALARELLQSKEERSRSYADFRIRELENQKVREALLAFKIKATRKNILKYRLFLEIHDRVTQTGATCVFCGKLFGFTEAMFGNEIEVVPIIPPQLRFDFSQANSILAHRSCGLAKDKLTAYDYMESTSPRELEKYITRVKDFYDRQLISYSKYNKLLTPARKLKETDFILRQLQETRFISQKTVEILSRVCRDVYVTTGKITKYLRQTWGWDDVLLHLQLPQFKSENLTKTEERKSPEEYFYTEEVITGEAKRRDPRNRALDALIVACTKQDYIQRLNTLPAKDNQDFMYFQIRNSRFDPVIIPERYTEKNRPFSALQVETAMSKILVSIQAGKKVETKSQYKIVGDFRFKNELTDMDWAFVMGGTPVASYAFGEHADNHHLAFYVDPKGSYQTHICTVLHAQERKKYGFSIVVENPVRIWEKIQNSGLEYPDSFLKRLPSIDWEFKFSIQQNEMFILGLQEQERMELLSHSNFSAISPYLFRVESFSVSDINFSHHLETDTEFSENTRIIKNHYRVRSLASLLELQPFKVKISYLGKILLP